MFMRTERLFLRPAWPEDRDAVLCELSEHLPVAALGRFPASFMAKLECAQSVRAGDPHLPQFLIVLPGKGSGVLAGFAGLVQGKTEIDLACWIVREYRGMGYATECLRALIQIADMLGCDGVGAEHSFEDQAFGRVLRKVGFYPTGQIILEQSRRGETGIPAMRYHCELSHGGNGPDFQTGQSKAAAMRAA